MKDIPVGIKESIDVQTLSYYANIMILYVLMTLMMILDYLHPNMD